MTSVEFLWQTLAMEKGQHTRLQEARERAGFPTKGKAADRFGWKKSTYNAHENGQNRFDFEAARVYAEAFRVDPGWLLGMSEDPEPKTTVQAAIEPVHKYSIKPDPDVWKAATEAALSELGVDPEAAARISEVILSVAYAQLPAGLGLSPEGLARQLVQDAMRRQRLSRTQD